MITQIKSPEQVEKMPFTAAQTTAFFINANQMALSADTREALALEGIVTVADLAEFEDDEFTQISRNLRNPPNIPDPANPGAFIHQGPIEFSAKSLKRLKVAANAVRYYEAIGRDITSQNMHYNNTLKNFEIQWKSILEKVEKDGPEVPKITRNLKITRWSESFKIFLSRTYGVRKAALSYVIRENVQRTDPAPALANNRPHSEEHGSVEGEMIARLSHDNPLYRDDNQKVYDYLEEATRNTTFSATIKPFEAARNGRSAHSAILSQHAGEDKWQKELKEQETMIKTRKWKGNSNFSHEKFVEQHRAAYISMQQCSNHVAYQLPNEQTRVRHLMEAIECNDPQLQAALAAIRLDKDGDNAKCNNFENAVAYLLPTCPVSRKRKSYNNDMRNGYQANISAFKGGNQNSKPSKGKTGVELRFYKHQEYRALTDEQKEELRTWREEKKKRKREDSNQSSSDNQDGNSGNTTKKLRKVIASVMREELKKQASVAQEEEDELDKVKNFLVSFTNAKSGSSSSSDPSTKVDAQVTAAATKLKSILKVGGKPSKRSD